jgi:hypothetical protein
MLAEPRPAILLWNGGAEQTERSHLADDGTIETLLAIGHKHAREQFVLRVSTRGIAHHALLVRELPLEIQRMLGLTFPPMLLARADDVIE